MSEELIAKLKAGYEGFNRGDYDVALGLVHPDVEFFPPGGQAPYRGAEAFGRWMEPDALEDQVIESSEFVANGNRVLVRQRIRARGAASGIELDFEAWSVWRFDDSGLVTRIEAFLGHEEAEARRAAGLD
jgi:ketosteroid isomerase-like protein